MTGTDKDSVSATSTAPQGHNFVWKQPKVTVPNTPAVIQTGEQFLCHFS